MAQAVADRAANDADREARIRGLYAIILAREPTPKELAASLAFLDANEGDAEAAESELKRALESDSEHLGSYLLWGQIAEQRGDLKEALRHVGQAETLEPYNAEVHVKLGTLYAQQSQWEHAARHLEGMEFLFEVLGRRTRFDPYDG